MPQLDLSDSEINQIVASLAAQIPLVQKISAQVMAQKNPPLERDLRARGGNSHDVDYGSRGGRDGA